MDEKTTQRVENSWKTLTLIATIAAAGFAAATHLSDYKTRADARSDHAAIRQDMDEAVDDVEDALDSHDEELAEIRYINVQIAFEQKNVADRLEILATQQREARSRSSRDEQEDRIESLERRIKQRSQAARKVRPPKGLKDPLRALD